MQANSSKRVNHDPKDAPVGYYAVLKAEAKPAGGGNICRACDWRPNCYSGPIDEMPPGHNCRGHELIGRDGKLYVRADGCSVLFKRMIHDAEPMLRQHYDHETGEDDYDAAK